MTVSEAANTPPAAGSAAKSVDQNALSLEGTNLAPLDRVFPAKAWPFMALVLAIVASAWFAGLALAPDKAKFLKSPEWRVMPFYLAAHLIAVRLFVSAYARSFRRGVKYLDVGTAQAVRGVRSILGPAGLIGAMLIAAPFCFFDFQYLVGADSRYERMGGTMPIAVDYLMWGTWAVEWTINALIWVMLVGFLIKNTVMIKSHAFRAPIEIVVHEQHYRPFLQMSAQGASIMLGFSAMTIFYLWYTGGELTDYAGLAITGGLLLVGFIPPWVLLRQKVRRTVELETQALRITLAGSLWRDQRARKGETGPAIPLEQRLEESLTIFRISHLEHLKLNLGGTEARAIFVRLLAPLIGIAWQVTQNFQGVSANLDRAATGLKVLLAKWLM